MKVGILAVGLIALASSFGARAESQYSHDSIDLTGASAKELFAQLDTEDVAISGCLEYRYSSSGGDGTVDAICIKPSDEIIQRRKEIAGLTCEMNLQSGESICTIPVLTPGTADNGFTQYLYGARSNELGKALKGDFLSSDGNYSLSCKEYVQGRLFDCMVGVKQNSN
jgi:hypothetical protein